MKKLSVLLLIYLLAFNFSYSYAQGDSQSVQDKIDTARQDYLFQYANYADALKVYQTSKEAFEKFGTLASQKQAIEGTKRVLDLRAEVLRTYLQLLKLTLRAQKQLDIGLYNTQVGKIEATQAFLETHRKNIQRTQSVLGVNSESERLQREAEAIQDLNYETLTYILIGQAQGLEYHIRMSLEKAMARAEDNREALEQGASDVRRKLTTVRVIADRVTDLVISSEQKQTGKVMGAYKEAQKHMHEAKRELREAGNLVKEIERAIDE